MQADADKGTEVFPGKMADSISNPVPSLALSIASGCMTIPYVIDCSKSSVWKSIKPMGELLKPC